MQTIFEQIDLSTLQQPLHANFFTTLIDGKQVEIRKFPKNKKGLSYLANEVLFRSGTNSNYLNTRVHRILEIKDTGSEIVVISENPQSQSLADLISIENATQYAASLALVAEDVELNLRSSVWDTNIQRQAAIRSAVSHLPTPIRPIKLDWDRVVLSNAGVFQKAFFNNLNTKLAAKQITAESYVPVKNLVDTLVSNVDQFKFREVGYGVVHGRPGLGNMGFDDKGKATITAFEAATPYYIRYYNAASTLGHLITRYAFNGGKEWALQFLHSYRELLGVEVDLFNTHFLPILSQRLIGDLSDITGSDFSLPDSQNLDEYYVKVVADVNALLLEFGTIEG